MATLIGLALTVLILALPSFVPRFPASLATPGAWVALGGMFLLTLAGSMLGLIPLGIAVRRFVVAFVAVFALAALAQTVSAWNPVKTLGLESVFFSVLFGLLIRNTVGLPRWLEPAVRSEYYIKIGLVLLGTSVLFGEIMKAGFFGIAQSVVVVFSVWYFTFWLASAECSVDEETWASCWPARSVDLRRFGRHRHLRGDPGRLAGNCRYVVSLVLVVRRADDVPDALAGAVCCCRPWWRTPKPCRWSQAHGWAVRSIRPARSSRRASSAGRCGRNSTAVIVKSSQNVLLGVAAFAISIYWSLQGDRISAERPTVRVLWDRFPKFVIGFVLTSLLFSFCLEPTRAKELGALAKGVREALFSVAFVCIGLETDFKILLGRENRRSVSTFLIAQSFNIVVTLVMALLLFGWLAG